MFRDGCKYTVIYESRVRMVKTLRVLRKFFVNGIIMTATSLLLRMIGVAFGAFISDKLGTDGMGLYTLIMSVYGLAVTAASSGVNLAATRMCAEAIGREDAPSLRATLRRCLTYAIGCGTLAGLLLFFGADLVADVWLGDARCKRALCLLAISLPFIAASNVFHGYFTAVRRVAKSAATQIFEQLFKILVTVWALLSIVPDDLEWACIALVGGGALAEVASFLMAFILYLADRRRWKRGTVTKAAGRALTRELFGITIPVASAAIVRSSLTTLEHMLIPRGLRANPATAETALASYGVMCGMVMPVVLFPTALLYSFTGLLVPEFAESDARGDKGRIGRMITRAMGMTMLFSLGCAGLMTVYAEELGMFIYQNADAGRLIRVMAPLIPVMYLDHAVDAMLKGLGEQLYTMKVNILDAAMCAFFVWILCPRMGIYGYIVTIYLSEMVNASLSLHRLAKVTEFSASVGKMLVRPLVAVIGAAAMTKLCGLAECGGWAQLILGLICSVGVYLLLLMLLGVIKPGELRRAVGVMR